MTHTNNPTEQQATPTSEEELDEILAKHGAEAGELTASLKDALLAWRDAAVVEARKEERLAAEADFGLTEEDEQHQRDLCKAVESRGVVYMSLQTGRVITEEAYWEWREWVESVGKPEGSVVEQHLKIDIAQLTHKEKGNQDE